MSKKKNSLQEEAGDRNLWPTKIISKIIKKKKKDPLEEFVE